MYRNVFLGIFLALSFQSTQVLAFDFNYGQMTTVLDKDPIMDWNVVLGFPSLFSEIRTGQNIPSDIEIRLKDGTTIDMDFDEFIDRFYTPTVADGRNLAQNVDRFPNFQTSKDSGKLLAEPFKGYRIYIVGEDGCPFCHVALGQLMRRFGGARNISGAYLDLTHPKHFPYPKGMSEMDYDSSLPGMKELVEEKKILFDSYPGIAIRGPTGFIDADKIFPTLIKIIKAYPYRTDKEMLRGFPSEPVIPSN